MTKLELLNYLCSVDYVGVADASDSLGVPRATASMALLRLARQGLAQRFASRRTHELRYRISDRGTARLDYLLNVPAHAPQYQPNARIGDQDMKRTKTHSGTFHCPNCFVEYDLVNEESLKCERCKGPLAEGSLNEVWDGEE